MRKLILLAVLVGAAAYLIARSRRGREAARPQPRATLSNYPGRDDDFDKVDIASDESFPASDPPSYYHIRASVAI